MGCHRILCAPGQRESRIVDIRESRRIEYFAQNAKDRSDSVKGAKPANPAGIPSAESENNSRKILCCVLTFLSGALEYFV